MITSRTRALFIAALLSLFCLVVNGQDRNEKNKNKNNDKTGKGVGSQVVDSGSFGIFVNGKRIGTETFRIEQGTDVSVASSQIKIDNGSARSEQSSEMRVAPNGNLQLYTWRATVPLKEESVIEPNEQFIVEHITFPDQKKQDVPYVLPLSTVVLDDNFFSQREILVWRYLATGCTPQDGQLRCGPARFGILVPRQHVSSTVDVELLGREKISVKGVDKELNKIRVTTESVQWLLWVADQDESYKVIKMAVPASNAEIIRD
ncbi:MAG TPA: hypothetical protein VN176_14610 [Verrucomicrobiae bacterium]|jgi:hypothetical protein|nr:hypothetical protein [Verrucomicrobiae bacterium]